MKEPRYRWLEVCLRYYDHELLGVARPRWSSATIMAARLGQFEPECQTWNPPDWVAPLDALEKQFWDDFERSRQS